MQFVCRHILLLLILVLVLLCSATTALQQKQQAFAKKALMIGSICGAVLASGAWLFSPSDDQLFKTADDIPKSYFSENREIKGVVVKITDGDTFRIRHTGKKGNKSPAYEGKLSENTIAVRIAAVDTPETAKQGRPGQPFSQEASEFTRQSLLNKRVTVQLLKKDRYGRALAFVRYADRQQGFRFWSKAESDLSEQLLQRGLAVVYRQGGAEVCTLD